MRKLLVLVCVLSAVAGTAMAAGSGAAAGRLAKTQQAMNFVAAIKGEMKPLCVASEALEDLKVAREYIR